jgi:hypothetical protein
VNSNEQLEVKHLLDVFAERPTEVLDGPAHAARRARVVNHLQAVLETARPEPITLVRRIPWKTTLGVLSIAAGTALFVRHYGTQENSVAPVGPLRALTSNGNVHCEHQGKKEWSPCEPVTTESITGLRTFANSSVRAETLVGVRLTLAPSSTLQATDTLSTTKSSRVTLIDGSVDVEVPKLGPERQFSVVTPDTTITVHGTAFTVTVRPTSARTTRTCVDLREGTIDATTANRVERLKAPARFGCDDMDAPQSAPDPEKPKATGSEGTVSTAVHSESLRTTHRLAQETRLLQTALGAERRKDYVTAEKSLRQLLAQNPNSVVAPEARAALERIADRKR